MNIFQPIEKLADLITLSILNLDRPSYAESTVNFFILDLIKISLMLLVINYLMAIVRFYLPMEKISGILAKKRFYGMDYLLAAILGMITPFCSCSSIPLFIGFLGAGIPLGITFTFLIASPLINESSLFLFPTIFGTEVTIIYNVMGIAIAMLGGFIIQKLNMTKHINPELLALSNRTTHQQIVRSKTSISKLLKLWWQESLVITKKVFPYVLLGVAIGSAIHGFIPEDLVGKVLSGNEFLSVPLAVLVGVPLYANSISVIPIIQALVSKGVPIGTGLAFITSTVTLSIPEALILKKAISLKLLTIFFGITTIGSILIGWVLNWLY